MVYLGQDPGLLCIDGQYFPCPSTYNVIMSDLDSSDTTRNENGMLVRNRVRQGVTKIELAYLVEGWQAKTMMACIAPAQVTVKFYDPRQDTQREAKMYVGDRTCTMKRFLPNDSIDDIMWEVTFNLVEY